MKKLNLELIEAILKTDFLFLENKKIKNLKAINTTSASHLNLLDVIELNSRLKQFIRILQFVKKQNNSINILVEIKQHLKILKIFILKNRTFFVNSIKINDNIVKNIEKVDYLSLYLFLNKKNNFKDAFFIQEINSYFEKENKGTYKILSNFNSFKKFIFFLALFQNVLKQNKKN